jgi:hypothetical protein
MRWTKSVCVLVMLIMAGVALGAGATQPIAPVTWATTMPAIELSHQPLEKVLNELKQKVPGFDFTISRINVPHDYPVLPTMTVENVSIGQFLNLIPSELPGVAVQLNDATNPPWQNPTPLPLPFATLNITPAPIQNEPEVRLFGLEEIIDSRCEPEKPGVNEKQVSDNVLSLIQAALEQSDTKPMPILKMHASTKTLIFKGTADQAEIVGNAIASLKTSDEGERYQMVRAATQPSK